MVHVKISNSRPNPLCVSQLSEKLVFVYWALAACDIPGRQTAVSGPHMARGVGGLKDWGGGGLQKDLVGSVNAFIGYF